MPQAFHLDESVVVWASVCGIRMHFNSIQSLVRLHDFRGSDDKHLVSKCLERLPPIQLFENFWLQLVNIYKLSTLIESYSSDLGKLCGQDDLQVACIACNCKVYRIFQFKDLVFVIGNSVHAAPLLYG